MSVDNASCYKHESVEQWIRSAFVAAGVRPADAAATATTLVRTSLRGIDTHGITRVPDYLAKLKSGELNPVPVPTSAIRNGMLFFDGDGGLGQAVASEAVRLAIDGVQETGILACIIRRSGHLAALGQFVLQAAEAGMIAFLCQETPPLMALEGSSRPAIGNNPIAFAFPVAGRPPFVFDMATSVVARGNILQAIRDKLPAIPLGWAIGPDGLPTTDPSVALKGAMLPTSDHKGIGLAMFVQVLAGSLSGSMTAASAREHGSMSSAGNVSAFLLVINPENIIGRTAFDAHVADWLAVYLEASGEGSRYPGERAAASEARRRRDGIPLPQNLISELKKVGEQVGHPFDIPTVNAGGGFHKAGGPS